MWERLSSRQDACKAIVALEGNSTDYAATSTTASAFSVTEAKGVVQLCAVHRDRAVCPRPRCFTAWCAGTVWGGSFRRVCRFSGHCQLYAADGAAVAA